MDQHQPPSKKHFVIRSAPQPAEGPDDISQDHSYNVQAIRVNRQVQTEHNRLSLLPSIPNRNQGEAYALSHNTWTQTDPNDCLDSIDPESLTRDIENLQEELRVKCTLLERLKNPEDRRSNVPARNIPETNESDTEIQYEYHMLLDGYQIQVSVDGEVKDDDRTQEEAQIQAEALSEAEADLDTQIEDRVREVIARIGDEIEASGDGGVITNDNNPDEPVTPIGTKNTKLKIRDFESIDWSDPSKATRTLLRLLFKREALATRSLTGKASPAFRNHPVKRRLDSNVVADIEHVVHIQCNVPKKDVRAFITSTCADENRILKSRHRRLIRDALGSPAHTENDDGDS